ncbi:MAG: class I fructose-bisphosphate aldolase [Armatimonadota bacterium]
MNGKQLRLRRLFSNGRSVIVPMDHPVFFGPIDGLINPKELVTDAANSPANGVLLTLATMNRVVDCIGNLGTIARIDGTVSRYGSHLSETDRISSVEYAVASGADACVLNVYVGVDNERDLLRKLGETAEACDRWGLPLVGEMIPYGALAGHYNAGAEKPGEDELAEQVATATRIGAEMGADIIKTNYTGSRGSFRMVVESATVPVLVAGGPCGDSVEGLLQMVEDCMAAGAAGVCIGRNIWQRDNRKSLLNAVCRIVHNGISASDAASSLKL